MLKRVFAIIGVALLAAVWIIYGIAAFTVTKNTEGLLYGALAVTILVPIVMWFLIRMYDLAHRNDDKNISMSEMRKYQKRIKNGESPEKIAEEIDRKYNINQEDK